MKLYQFALVAALPLLAIGCGGDLFGGDGGTGDSGGGVCPQGTTLYRLVPGTYTIQSVTGVSDPCMIGFAGLANMQRKVTNDNQGNVNLLGSMDSMNGFGAGNIFCNKGHLIAAYANDDGAGCTETISATSDVVLTADNTMSITFSQTRSSRAAACTVAMGTPTCAIAASMIWKM